METQSRIRRQEPENTLKWLPQTGLGRANALWCRAILEAGKPLPLSEGDSNYEPFCDALANFRHLPTSLKAEDLAAEISGQLAEDLLPACCMWSSPV